MKISVITTSFNGAKTIRSALDSVLGQRGVEVEYIVTDGGSSDGTVEILKEYEPKFAAAGIAYQWTSEPDKGMYDGINKGMARATGEVIGILNTDDVLASEEVLAKIAEGFEAGEKVDCVFGTVKFVRPTATLAELRAAKTHRIYFIGMWRPWMLQWGWMPAHPAVYIRRTCFEQWGGYVPDKREYKIAADFELLIRFFRVHKMTWRRLKLITTIMRTGGVSTDGANANKRLNEEIVKGNRANGYSCWMWMLLPKYFIKIWEFILPKVGLIR